MVDSNSLNFKIYDPIAQLIASGSGGGSIPGSSIQSGTITSTQIAPNTITSANIAPNTITSSNLSSGAAADNINNGSDGAIIASKIAGSPFLPLIGGILSGDIIMTSPAKVQQSASPMVGIDLTNKTYVDKSFYIIKGTAPFSTYLNGPVVIDAFSGGNFTIVDPTIVPPNDNIIYTTDNTGLTTITNNNPYKTQFRLRLYSGYLKISNDLASSALLSIFENTLLQYIGTIERLYCLDGVDPVQFTSHVVVVATLEIAANSSVYFRCIYTFEGDNTTTTMTVDPVGPGTTTLEIERIG